ncbi:AhpA/YtjB family protein [Colwellia sp. MEBiC06753]
MTQTDLPLYPKISSIYNKILQLAIAIVLIVVLLNFILAIYSRQASLITEQQQVYGDNYIEQAAQATLVLLQHNKKSALTAYIDSLSQPAFVDSAVLYDETGQIIAQSGQVKPVSELYPSGQLVTESTPSLKPFVIELRDERLQGYLRLTIVEGIWQQGLIKANDDNQEMMRIMLLMAGAAGFLLTRGLSRFSRQGYRFKAKS